jgi:hypothetical protein
MPPLEPTPEQLEILESWQSLPPFARLTLTKHEGRLSKKEIELRKGNCPEGGCITIRREEPVKCAQGTSHAGKGSAGKPGKVGGAGNLGGGGSCPA